MISKLNLYVIWNYLSAILLKVEIIVRIILDHMFHEWTDVQFEVVIFSKPRCQLINKSCCQQINPVAFFLDGAKRN